MDSRFLVLFAYKTNLWNSTLKQTLGVPLLSLLTPPTMQ